MPFQIFSKSAKYFVRVIPGDSIGDTMGFGNARKGKYAQALYYALQADRSYKLLHEIKLQNPVAPVDLLLSDQGQFVTFDNWYNLGYGKVVAIYGASGKAVRSYELGQLYPSSLEPDKDVAILQVGGSTERAAAFRTGRIIAFPAPPGVIHLTHGMPHRILASTADFPRGFPFPYVCPTASKTFVKNQRDTMKRLLMALIDATHFYKTRKEEAKKVMARYTRHSNEAFLEAAYLSSAKLFEQVPLVNRDGMDVQVKDAVSRKPSSTLKVDDLVDDSLVLELEKEGFIGRIYKQ